MQKMASKIASFFAPELSSLGAQWGVCIMAAHSNRWLLRGKWVAGQSVRCCFPVFGKELTVSFALALGRFFSSKGCQIERFFFSSTSIKGKVAESAKTSRFWPRKRMDYGSLLRTL